VIFDIVEYIIMEWTMPNESRICRSVLILNTRRKVLLVSLPQSSIGHCCVHCKIRSLATRAFWKRLRCLGKFDDLEVHAGVNEQYQMSNINV
jgi:hypothetical protein